MASQVSQPLGRRRALRDGAALAGAIAFCYVYAILGDGNGHGPTAEGLIDWAVDPANPSGGIRGAQ
jgi:hypothetical protein